MVEVTVRNGEQLERALRRFKELKVKNKKITYNKS